MSKEAMKLALRSIQELVLDESDDAPALQGARMRKQKAEKALREALAEQPVQQELVAVKHMMRWVDNLKWQSDNGQHMNIPSGLSSGTCWELAIELEQFIKSTPPQRTWVGLTYEEKREIRYSHMTSAEFIECIEAKVKDKNT